MLALIVWKFSNFLTQIAALAQCVIFNEHFFLIFRMDFRYIFTRGERQRNPQIILSILSQNFDWSVCTTSSSSWLLFFFCLYTVKIANSSQIMQVAVWWEIIFVANKTRQIMQRIFNDRKFFMGIGKYQKICILLLHTGFGYNFGAKIQISFLIL